MKTNPGLKNEISIYFYDQNFRELKLLNINLSIMLLIQDYYN